MAVVTVKVGHFLEILIDTDRNCWKSIIVENDGISLDVDRATLTDRVAEPFPAAIGADVEFMRRVVSNTPELYAVDDMGLINPRCPRITALSPVVVKVC